MIKKILFISLITMLMIGVVIAERTDEHGYKGETTAESLLLLYEDNVISYAEYQRLTENLNKNMAEDGLNVSNEIDIPEETEIDIPEETEIDIPEETEIDIPEETEYVFEPEVVTEEKQPETVTEEKQEGLVKFPDKQPETDNPEQIITELKNLETTENNQVIAEKSFIDTIITFLNGLIGG